MLRLASGSSRSADSDEAARELAVQIGRQLEGMRARAAIFFATTPHGPGYGRFERALRAATGAEHVIGCSASGVVAAEGEVEHGPGVSALALAGDLEVRRFFVPSLRGRAEEVGRELGRVALSLEREPRTIVLLADSYNLAPDELIAGIGSIAPDAIVVGGGASEDGSVGETAVIGHGACAGNAVAGLAIGGLRMRTVVSPSCVLYGGWRMITAAQGNRILELDGEPALRTYLDCLPRTLRSDVKQALRSTLAALACPPIEGDLPESYVVRALLGADQQRGALLVGDEVTAGMEFAIAVRDPATAREALDANLERFCRDGGSLAGALYFNGVERGESFYGVAELESAYLRRRLGDLPIAGLYCGAEFAPLGGRNRFHQYAGVLVGIEQA
jgi:small ligand-binding sensory domain FIST